MEIFQDRIDTITHLLSQGKLTEAFEGYRVLVLMVNRLNTNFNPQLFKKTKELGDKILLEIFKREIKNPSKLNNTIDLRRNIEQSGFKDKLEQHHKICELINEENFLDALKHFEKC